MAYTRTLLTLAALSLATPALAQSLTLNNGDSITVNYTGTHGIINSTPVNNATINYAGGGSVNAVEVNGTAGFTLGNGGTLSVAGNYGDALHSSGSGPVMVTGGTATGGGFGSGVFSSGTAPVQISGGTFGGQTSVAAYSSGTVVILGGTFNSPLLAYVGGTITLAGGTINANGTTLTTTAGSTSTINLFGTGFFYTVNGGTASTPITSGSLPSNASGTITGTLSNSTLPFTTGYSNEGVINVNVGTPPPGAPEPSPALALAVGILGLGALAIKARRRTA